MSTTDEPPTKKTRGDNDRTNDVSSAVMQVLQDMLRTVQERLLSSTPFSVSGRGENIENGNTPTISNVGNSNQPIINKTATRQDQRGTNNVVIRNIPQELQSKVSASSSLLDEDAMEYFFAMGYDSDGELPDFDCFEDERNKIDEYNEPEIQDTPSLHTTTVATATPTSTAGGEFVPITREALMKLKVDELRRELKKRGIPVSGNKNVLQVKLQKAMDDKVPVLTETDKERPAQPNLFHPNAFWERLHPGEEPVEDPTDGTHFFSPTDPEQAKPKLYDYPDIFDRPPFTKIVDVPVFDRFGRRKIDNNQSKAVEKIATSEGTPDQSFLDKHNLDHNSSPINFFEAFCPTSLTDKWTTYTNHKAMLANAGQSGKAYPDFKPFTVHELRQHIGVRILHGLSPSPRIEMKFSPQAKDPINGNDFVSRSLGPNATRRHKHFRRFFACQNPVAFPKPKKTHPLWKIDEFLCHVLAVSMLAWTCGDMISVDEQTIGFQGRHGDKLRITYKAEGDGFQCDALCSDGYTYCFYFRNVPAPSGYIEKGHSPLHARVMWLFDQLQHKNHRCGMDNLYTSVNFFKAAYNHPNQVLCHGVARKSGRGVPSSVLQDEVQNKKEQLRVRGTLKAAKLVNDPDCPDMCAVSVYDTKPVHFLTLCNSAIKWVQKKRKVFDKGRNLTEKIRFLRLNITDDYNNGMGQVDIADQLRGTYRFDKWLRNYKWWHAIYWWAFQVLMINSYIVYKKVCKRAQVSPVSHYEYQKDIAMGWIDPENFGAKAGYKTPSDQESNLQEMSTISSASSGSKKRSNYLNSASLDPVKGKLRNRLDSSLAHWPSSVPQDKNRNRSPCQLCRWATDRRVRKLNQTAYCQECNMVLCLGDCYKTFHTVWDIVSEKADICRRCDGSM